jgi:hypothetical protein
MVKPPSWPVRSSTPLSTTEAPAMGLRPASRTLPVSGWGHVARSAAGADAGAPGAGTLVSGAGGLGALVAAPTRGAGTARRGRAAAEVFADSADRAGAFRGAVSLSAPAGLGWTAPKATRAARKAASTAREITLADRCGPTRARYRECDTSMHATRSIFARPRKFVRQVQLFRAPSLVRLPARAQPARARGLPVATPSGVGSRRPPRPLLPPRRCCPRSLVR